MKSKTMIMAWDQATLSDDAKERMLGEILHLRREYHNIPAKKYAVIAAACALVVFVLCFAALSSGILKKTYSYALPNGQMVAFRAGRSMRGDAMYAYNDAIVQRPISDEEWQALFPTLSGIFDGFAIFKADTGEMLHFEGWVASEERYFTNDAGVTMRVVGGVGRLQVLASKSGLPVSDTVISGNESMTDINGVPVRTGYSISKPNSRGERTVVFFAEFTQNDATIFLSFSGDAKESKQVGEHLSEILYDMLSNGIPDLNAVKY